MTWEIFGDLKAHYLDCFRMFNPLTLKHTQEVVDMWVSALLYFILQLTDHPATASRASPESFKPVATLGRKDIISDQRDQIKYENRIYDMKGNKHESNLETGDEGAGHVWDTEPVQLHIDTHPSHHVVTPQTRSGSTLLLISIVVTAAVVSCLICNKHRMRYVIKKSVDMRKTNAHGVGQQRRPILVSGPVASHV